jgi:hypothetical protein
VSWLLLLLLPLPLPLPLLMLTLLLLVLSQVRCIQITSGELEAEAAAGMGDDHGAQTVADALQLRHCACRLQQRCDANASTALLRASTRCTTAVNWAS